jgi:hypothetical protein
MTKKTSITALNNEEIEELFSGAFAEQIGDRNNIQEFDCKCVREPGQSGAKVEVTIFGLAGSPTPEDFKKTKLEVFKKVVVSRENKESVKFVLVPKATTILNTNDYVVTYQSV